MAGSFFNTIKGHLIPSARESRTASAPHSRNKFILANRSGGLGERLCAMMNAIRLAAYTGADFRFHWQPHVWSQTYARLDNDVKHQIVGQGICAREEIFSEDYITKHGLSYVTAADIAAFPWAGLSPGAIAKARPKGWFTEQRYIDVAYDAAYARACEMNSMEAFERIEFSDDIRAVIAATRALETEPFTALHLRSGDLVYGDLRRWGFWGDKVINPLVADDIIAKIKARGETVILFGQDKTCLAQLAATHNVTLAHSLISPLTDTDHGRAIAEIILMSRASEIVSGDSGFSRAASMIRGKRIKGVFSLYGPIAYSDITRAGLERDALDLHPLTAAYAWWQAYAMGRTLRSVPQLIEMIDKACALDPDNMQYVLIKTALLYRLGEDSAAEAVLADRFAGSTQDHGSLNHPVIHQLLFRYGTPKFTHDEQFDDFIAAGRRPGNAQALRLSGFIAARHKLLGTTA